MAQTSWTTRLTPFRCCNEHWSGEWIRLSGAYPEWDDGTCAFPVASRLGHNSIFESVITLTPLTIGQSPLT
jgi:hypothetical protein